MYDSMVRTHHKKLVFHDLILFFLGITPQPDNYLDFKPKVLWRVSESKSLLMDMSESSLSESIAETAKKPSWSRIKPAIN